MVYSKKAVLIGVVCVLPMAAAGEDGLGEGLGKSKAVTWEASAEVGYILTSGNSDSETLKSRFEGKTSYDAWEHLIEVEALNSSQNDERSAEKYVAAVQSNYSISARAYGFSRVDWEKDRFSGYEYQASVVVGMGYKALKTEHHDLRFEIAPGFRVSEPVTGGKQEEAIGRLSQSYKWKITKGASLEQSASSEYGDTNTRSRFKLALTSQINGSLSMKAGFSLKHNSDVAPGVEKTDRETSLTLVYTL